MTVSGGTGFVEVVFLLLAVAGWVGSILPVLPGLPLAAGALLGYAVATGFREVTPVTVAAVLAAAAVSYGGSYILGSRLVRRYGKFHVSPLVIFVGALAGLVTVGPAGLLFGPVAVVLAVALMAGVGARQGLRAAVAVGISMASSLVFELVVCTWIVYLLVRAAVR